MSAEDKALAEPGGPLTVSQLTTLVKRAIDDALPTTVHVVGEISNYKAHSSGHHYMTLKDASAEVACVMWRSDAARLKFQPTDGMEVVATGRVEVWERAGRYQLYVRRLEPRGVGALELAFRQLCEKLRAEGLFDEARKKPIAKFPRTLAIVTSPTGAAIRDILKTLNRRYPCVRVLIHPVRVQGEGAADEIAAAIRRINEQADRLGPIDTLIVARGGGSIEDLWAFNEEPVARAIAASRIPVVTGVGHEVDTTIADLVADARAHTPTAAAEMAVPVLSDLLEALDTAAARLRRAVANRLALAAGRLDVVAQHEFFRRPLDRIRRLEQQLDEYQSRLMLAGTRRLDALRRRLHAGEIALARVDPVRFQARLAERLTRLAGRLDRATMAGLNRAERRVASLAVQLARAAPARRIDAARSQLDPLERRSRTALAHRLTLADRSLTSLAQRLDAVDPRRVLDRGYSITRDVRRGRVITRPSQVRPGAVIETATADGPFTSQVIDPDQPTLF